MHRTGERALLITWGLEAPATKGPKARFSVDGVAQAAVVRADESGLAGVSLARVAAALGVTTTALYRYVDSKDVLVELMVHEAIGTAPRLTSTEWRDGCREWVELLAVRYRSHPWLADVRPTGMPRSPNAYAWMESLLSATGIDLSFALMLDGIVRAYASLAEARTAPSAWLVDAVSTRFPAVAASGSTDRIGPDVELAYALDVALAGRAAALDE